MSGPEKFALLNERLLRMNREHPLAFDAVALVFGLALAGISCGLLMLLDRIAR